MSAFVASVSLSTRSAFSGAATCGQTSREASFGPNMAYDMSGNGALGVRRIKSSAVEKDSRSFKVSFVLPSESRLYTFRELQNVFTTKVVPFSSWYAEQQRIQKMGGRILKVELCSGGQMRSCGNS